MGGFFHKTLWLPLLYSLGSYKKPDPDLHQNFQGNKNLITFICVPNNVITLHYVTLHYNNLHQITLCNIALRQFTSHYMTLLKVVNDIN